MPNKLKELLARVETWPEAVQEEVVASIEAIEEEFLGLRELSSDDVAALERSADDVRHGRFATEDQVREVFDRHRGK
jgi:hypothetical protein